jgi:hypothetical protein
MIAEEADTRNGIGRGISPGWNKFQPPVVGRFWHGRHASITGD